jgi:hypothetical protein
MGYVEFWGSRRANWRPHTLSIPFFRVGVCSTPCHVFRGEVIVIRKEQIEMLVCALLVCTLFFLNINKIKSVLNVKLVSQILYSEGTKSLYCDYPAISR